MKNVIWVGNRLSDIEDCNEIFDGSINLYGTNTLKDICFTMYRANNNISNLEIDRFIEDNLNKFLEKNPNNRFMFYNPKKTYTLNKKIQNNTLCLNDYFFLEILNDKISCHNLFNDIVKFAPYVTLLGQDIKYANLRLLFPQSNQYVIQSSKSSGGFETYLMNDTNFHDLIPLLKANKRYLVSTYIEDNISFNVHIIIQSEQDYIVFPPSQQIIENNNNRLSYRGADFINTKIIIFDKMNDILKAIVKKLARFGYKGVLGVDFIQDSKGNIYLVELNCRFQGSSFLINRVLKENHLPSIQELNYAAFNGESIQGTIPSSLSINYASIFYYQGEQNILLIENAKKLEQIDDGLSSYKHIQDFAYLYKDIYISS